MATAQKARRRIKTVKDNITLYSLGSRKTNKIPRRNVPNIADITGSNKARQHCREPEYGNRQVQEMQVDLEADDGSDGTDSERSSYYKKKEKLLEHWDAVRDKIVKGHVEASCLPSDEECQLCFSKDALIRCLDCAYGQCYCHDCAVTFHSKRNRFHFMEEWKDGAFVPFEFVPVIAFPRRTFHGLNCIQSVRRICVITLKGVERQCDVCFCTCTDDAVVLIKHGLWPVSPKAPKAAIEEELMELLECLLLESHISLNSFYNALKWKSVINMKLTFIRDLYGSLLANDTFEQFRFFKYKMRHLRTISPDINDGTICPACPKETGLMFWNFDACFGLFRKKSAGKEPFPSLHGPLFFEDQEEVDNFLQLYKGTQKHERVDKECSRFQAGDAATDLMHSKGKSKAFDEKALFGCVCRHEFPVRFLDIKHGERLAYCVHLLQMLLDSTKSSSIKANVVYDIACKLHRHLLKTANEKFLNKSTIMVPAFHAFAHTTSCQLEYSIMYQEGAGMSNGEQCERLWSYMRCFSSITREMTASHRQDCLTDGLLYYAQKTLMRIGPLTVLRLQNAEDSAKASTDELLELLSKLPASTIEDVEIWQTELRGHSKHVSTARTPIVDEDWRKRYVQQLLLHRQLKKDVMDDQLLESEELLAPLVKKQKRVEKELKRIELENNIRRRWKLDADNVKEYIIVIEKEERHIVLDKMMSLAFDRWFLLQLKKKYSTGQSIANVLSRNINTKCEQIKRLCNSYQNRIAFSIDVLPPNITPIEYSKAIDTKSDVYSRLPNFGNEDIPSDVKRRAVELLAKNKRAKEELDLCRQDMINMLNHLMIERQKLNLAIDAFQAAENITCYNKGACSILKRKRVFTENLILSHSKAFVDSGFIQRSDVDFGAIEEVKLLNPPLIDLFNVAEEANDYISLSEDEVSKIVDTSRQEGDDTDRSFSLFLEESSDTDDYA